MSEGVIVWWVLLSVVSVLNIGAWFYAASLLRHRRSQQDHPSHHLRNILLWLSGVYVAVCAFRSFLPRIDLERICLVDSWLSSMLVGRAAATVAELCFIAQCALLLYIIGRGVNNRIVVFVALLLVPLITVAEGFSWYAVLTRNYLGSVFEESLWAIAGVLLVISFIALMPRLRGAQRKFIVAMLVFGLGFVAFMVMVDVPMYWTRYVADTAANVGYLSLGRGIIDAAGQCKVSYEWDVWRDEIPWMTLYFTIAVWVSIYLVHAPVFHLNDQD